MPAFVQQHLLLVFSLLVAVSMLGTVARSFLGLLFGKAGRQHGQVVVDYVQKHGYQLLNPALANALDESLLDMIKDPSLRDLARATSDITDIDGFADGGDDWFGFRCEIGSKAVTVFNFTRTPPLHSDSGPASYRVAKIQVDGLPRFSLEPRSVVTAIEALTGKLLHQPESTVAVDAAAQASFGSRYWLRGPDAAAVSAFFTPERIRFIESAALPGTLASNAHYLVYYESTAMRTEADYAAFVAVVERVVTHLL